MKTFTNRLRVAVTMLLFFAAFLGSARATVVTNLTQSAIESAIASGGIVTFGAISNGTITVTNTLQIRTNVVIDGTGANITFNGMTTSISTNVPGTTNTNSIGTRIFFITNSATLTLINLTVSNGQSTNGAGIFNSAGCTLIVSNCTLSGNFALGTAAQNGADGKKNGDNGGNGTSGSIGMGGAIFNLGTARLDRVSLFANIAAGSNGGNGGNGQSDSLFAGTGGNGGKGGTGYGGGIYNSGTLVLTNCGFQSNIAAGGDGGTPGSGGTAGWPGKPGSGGAGGPAYGGGIFNETNGSVVVNNSTFYTNKVAGGVSQHADPDSSGKVGGFAYGGGVYNLGSITFTNCTLTENASQGGAGGDVFTGYSYEGGNGGAARGGAIYSTKTADFVYCTIATNHVIGGTGGISAYPGNTGSKGSSQGGSIYNVSNGVVALHNTILSKGPNGGIYYASSATLVDNGYNLSSDASCVFKAGTHSTNNINSFLGPLANNGGITSTMALLTNSPAIDAGDPSICGGIDQRGTNRPQGIACDIGAFEFVRTYSISGKITEGTNVLSGISVTVGTNTTVSQTNGFFFVGNLMPGNYIVTPQPVGGGFTPSNQFVTIGTNAANPYIGTNATNVNFAANPVVLTPSLTSSTSSNSAGTFQLLVMGIPGYKYKIQASTNLTNWATLTTNTAASNGLVQLTDTNIALYPKRFFRIISTSIPTPPPVGPPPPPGGPPPPPGS